MKISIVIPTFNGERFLASTLDSVVNQSFSDFEVVISDDGSTDGTIDVISSFTDSRIRILPDRSRVGAEGNWNRALAAAAGEYVKVLAQDDLLGQDNLSVQLKALDRYMEASFAAVQRDIIGADGSTLMRGRGLAGLDGLTSARDAARAIVRSGGNQFGEGAAVLFRHAAGNSIGQFDGSAPYVIDVDYWLRLLEWGPMVAIRETHASFRVSSSSWSNSLAKDQGRQFRTLIRRVAENPRRSVGRRDVAIGSARAMVTEYLRKIFYLKNRSHL